MKIEQKSLIIGKFKRGLNFIKMIKIGVENIIT